MSRPLPDHLAAGKQAEAQAEQFLCQQGLKLVERNYRCKLGEIDLIMRDGDSLVFVEVRLRRHSGFGSAAESVTPQKQRKLILAAQHYLQHAGKNQPCRFDIVGLDQQSPPTWLKNAFET